MTLRISNYAFVSKLIEINFSSRDSESTLPPTFHHTTAVLFLSGSGAKIVSQKFLQVAEHSACRRHLKFKKSPSDLSGILFIQLL